LIALAGQPGYDRSPQTSDIRCAWQRPIAPHCQNPIEVADSGAIGEIVCPSCGGSVSPNERATKSCHTPPSPFQKIGRFELQELLGQGAFGSVWRAHDTEWIATWR
jgi:serine/threonine protein kinase